MDAGEPYDDISWELPAHYHLAVVATADPQVRAANLTALGEAPHPRGQVSSVGPVYLLSDTGQEGLLEARYRLARFKISIAERPFTVNGTDYHPGSWILPEQSGLASALGDAAAQLGLDFQSVGSVPDVVSHAAPAPRLGVWVPWADTDSIGWVRYSLDQRHIPYIYVRDEDIRAGKLRATSTMCCFMVTSISSWPSRFTGSPRLGVRCRSKKRARRRVTARPQHLTTSPVALAGAVLPSCSASSKQGGCSSHSEEARCCRSRPASSAGCAGSTEACG